MKLISWNVNGLRACVQKGFLDYFHAADADFFCIQESKLQEGQIALDLPGYHQYWNLRREKRKIQRRKKFQKTGYQKRNNIFNKYIHEKNTIVPKKVNRK